ncbi:MAG: DUF2007 domain-containing protein [Flavobacteriaceae bacterium]|nr:DUF2007 domain-containing protein [Flavobacteriaceae bacterium]MDG2313983.1 DUF2007 domain-containing protein [Flavobacteriaceae bacterium]
MSTPKFSLVFTGNMMDVLKIVEALEVKDIHPIIKDESESARLAGFGSHSQLQQVWVHEDEYETTKKLIEAL